MVLINSENPSGADNQQRRLEDSMNHKSSCCFDPFFRSETTRRASYWDEDIVRTSWRHGEVDRNDQPTST